MMKKVYLRSFGCQMNDHDSARVRDLLLQDGHSLIDKAEEADVLLFNTCSVRAHAEARVFGRVGLLKDLKVKRPEAVFGILGCMAEAQRDLIFKKLPHVDFLCGPADLDKVPEIINRIRRGGGRLIYLKGYRSKKIPEFSKKRMVTKTVYVKIMEGCSNFCSYCIVPYVRGEERSRPSKDILEEMKSLIGEGVKDITLLGQNVNSYGRGLKETINFPGLLRTIDKVVAGNATIKFVTSHPRDAGIDLFKAIGSLQSISKALHLPLQSGSNRILKKMNRGYTVERYKKLVDEFRNIVKGTKIMSDFIVGFPGETEKDFKDTLKAVKEIQFDAAYIFKYSPRPFTKASEFEDDVPKAEKERRHALLLSTQKEISYKKKKE
ncbi:tRNA (N6-isopentenyl adenosine(37)-C2)-methylthiotransferase MiaB [Candidatus Omnitrophota bacterium]